jgi:hypothetical protein
MKLWLLSLLISAPVLAQTYDVVLANGRVMDPETNLDAIRNIGLNAGRIAAISASLLTGRTTVDVKGLVVTAGFIDLHSHGQDAENYAYKARDGVTTALELEVGVNPVASWYAAREGRALINFGATSGHPCFRAPPPRTGPPPRMSAKKLMRSFARVWTKALLESAWVSPILPEQAEKRSWRSSNWLRSGVFPSLYIFETADRSSLAPWMLCKKCSAMPWPAARHSTLCTLRAWESAKHRSYFE